MRRHKSHDLGIRTLINGASGLLIAFVIFTAHFPPLRWLFTLVVAAIGSIANWEYCALVKKKGLFPAISLSISAVILYIWACFVKTQGPYPFFPSFWDNLPVCILGLAFLGCFIHFALTTKPPITHISTTFFGILYIAIPLGLFIQIIYFSQFQQRDWEGIWWIAYLLAVTKSADIGGYFIGSFYGKRKLALKLSPNKTLEGALGGLFASTLVSLVICFLGKHYGNVFAPFSYMQALFLGIVVGIIGQIGDLAESMLKRDAHVKDSNTFPGVGGILDMVDSLLFTAPLVYIFLRFIYV